MGGILATKHFKDNLYLIPPGVSVGLETGKAASHIPGP